MINCISSDIINILKCPKTGQALLLKNDVLETTDKLTYGIRDGIVDLCIDSQKKRQLQIEDSYNEISGKYDKWLMNSLYMKLVWGLDLRQLLLHIAEEIKRFPEGIILDVPVGTACYGVEFYKLKPNSIFIALDYSMGMLRVAKKRCAEAGINNVIFIRGDITNIPLKDEALSGCLSMNGFHAFLNPEEGAKEVGRVMKDSAPMIMIAACSGERWISNYVMNKMISEGLFSNSLPMNAYKRMLEGGKFSNFNVEMLGAMMFAKCEKRVI